MREMIARTAVSAVACFLLAGALCSAQEVKVGDPLPHWQKGELDIHFINTARGESTYQIFPDGTTFLVDASGAILAFGKEASDPLPARPSADISAGKVIVDYIEHFTPEVSQGHINYFMLTHFDSDHIGSYDPSLPMHESGRFRLTSIAEIGSDIVLDKMMDRDYPDYSYPLASRLNDDKMVNYKAFLDWTKEANGTKVEKWDPGSHSQVVELHDTTYSVRIQNLSGDGRFWTGKGEESHLTMPATFEGFPSAAIPKENAFSCSYILSYGDFDFFLGGDLQINNRDIFPYMDAESPVAAVSHKVEVMKANHHGTNETNSPELLSVLRPDVWVVSNWRDVQPRPATMDRVLAANPQCDIFFTNMPEKDIPVLGPERLSSIDEKCGHIVVRVAPGGESYMIYSLDDSDLQYRVKSTFGPYRCSR
jgi:beta-lactamase superfamily II metal-dependent hydrolase